MIIIFGHISYNLHMHLDAPLGLGENEATPKSITEIGGNAAIQAIAAARAGAKAALAGTIGNDVFGKTILDTLRREGLSTTSLAKHETAQTGVITAIHVPRANPVFINAAGANVHTNAKQLPEASLNQRTLLLLQTDLPAEINVDILRRAQSHDAKSILSITNPDNITEELTDLADLVIEKEEQTGAAYNCFCGTLAACLQAGMDESRAQNYANTAAKLCASKQGDYSALPYLDAIESVIPAALRMRSPTG